MRLTECEAFLLRFGLKSPVLEALQLVNAYLVCDTKFQMDGIRGMTRVNGHKAAVAAKRLWRVAILTAAGAVGLAAQAEAAIFYWQNPDPGISQPTPTVPPRRPRTRLHAAKKSATAEQESAKPQGPLVISISIAEQKLRIYDANGFFAEAPVSTGMPGHPTPMGVFSVIQKHKFHHSNIYSGAPMPYMQRITWSGVAIHAGVLPGRPASHGCIRMPMAFAVKMWNWTKMGARVVITPGEITPASFSHPLLATSRMPPQPIAADEPKTNAPMAAKADKAVEVEANAKPVIAATSPGLRSTLGHHDSAKPAADETRASAPSQRRTADARALPAANAPVTMSDATPAGDSAPASERVVSQANPEALKSEADPEPTKHGEAASGETITMQAEVAKVEAKPDDPKETRPSEALKAAAPNADPVAAPKRAGQIAVLVSRKDSKLYVRQNFAPWFEIPLTIAPSDRPLGTHVFTARVDRGDPNILHWSVVSLPAATRDADHRSEAEPNPRRRKIAGAGPVEAKPLPMPDSPTEALDRLTLPREAMARIIEALSTGGSIIVSDQGITAGETGEGTDFIISLPERSPAWTKLPPGPRRINRRPARTLSTG